MNTDTNPCWYIVTKNKQYCDLARQMTQQAVVTSVVIEELILQLYWSGVLSGMSLKENDILRDATVTGVLSLYRDGYLGGDNEYCIVLFLL